MNQNENYKNNVLKKINYRFPTFQKQFEKLEQYSSEIILFGSYAHDCERLKSDVDILFVGNDFDDFNPKDVITSEYDFLWLQPRKLNSKSWLSSELAIHIAHYGLWLKGDGLWKDKTFFSSAALTRKKRIIYNKLTSLYLQKDKSSITSKFSTIEKILLNILRLINLSNKVPNPPTINTLEETVTIDYLIQNIFEPHLLGQLGQLYLEEILLNIPSEHDRYNRFMPKYAPPTIQNERRRNQLNSGINQDEVVYILCSIYDSMRSRYLAEYRFQ